MTVDIVLLSYGFPEKAARAVTHVKASHYADIHLIVFDNASTSDKSALIQDCAFPTTLVHEAKNLSYAEANNRAARCGSGELILLLNNDCYVDPHCLGIMAECLSANPTAGIVGARLRHEAGSIQHAGVFFNPSNRPYHRYRSMPADYPACNLVEIVPAVTGACLMIRRAVWQELGGLDETYDPAYYEDIDLCLRSRVAGYPVWYEGAASAIHEEAGSVGLPGAYDRNAAELRNLSLFMSTWAAHYTDLNTLAPR